jgi:hypothetical protein
MMRLLIAASALLGGCGGTVVQQALTECQSHLIEMTRECRQPSVQCAPAKAGDAAECPQILTEVGNDQLGALIASVGFEVRGLQSGTVKFVMPWANASIEAHAYNSDGNLRLYATRVTEEPPALTIVNEWNRTKRYSRAHVDSDGDAVIESDLDIRGGVTPQTIKNFVKIFGISAGAFFIELRKGRST